MNFINIFSLLIALILTSTLTLGPSSIPTQLLPANDETLEYRSGVVTAKSSNSDGSGSTLGVVKDGLILGDASASFVTARGGNTARTIAARAGDAFNVRDYGAFGDGATHTARATLGVSTLSGLANWTAPSGAKPFVFVANYPYGVLFNLWPGVDAAKGATKLIFRASATVGVQIRTVSAAAFGTTTVVVGDRFVTADQTPIAPGVAVSGAGIADGTTVTAVTGFPGSWTVTLSAATTAAVPSGTYLTWSVRPEAGISTLPVLFDRGIYQGDIVSGPCIAAGTQVDHVNPAKMEIVLSAPTTVPCAAGTGLTFTPSWLANVQVGMTISGPSGAFAAGTMVASVDLTTGVVTLSTPTTGPLTAHSALTGSFAGSAVATPVTFYRPYTDSEGAGLEMDRLGIQAAINAAAAGVGGSVDLPAGAGYRLDGPIILPIYAPFGANQNAVSLGGPHGSINGAILRVTKDFGPGNAALTCGDPTAKSGNARGIYQGNTGYFCTGRLHDVRIKPLAFTFAFGTRPKWSGVPVAMDGIKEGPRLHNDRVMAEGFNHGIVAAIDHTRLVDVTLQYNFIGMRMDDMQPNLFGDEVFDRLYAPSNGWAGISVSPKAYINAEIRKPYLASNPWAIWCEPGAGAGQCIQGTTLVNGNLENAGCGIVKDGGIRDGWRADGGTRSLNNFRVINTFHGGLGAFGSAAIPKPVGGCTWAAYFDVGYATDFTIENVWSNDFPPVANAFAHILRVRRLDAFSAIGRGGFGCRAAVSSMP